MTDTCIVCSRVLERAMDGDGPPMGGLIFVSRGNYGSTLYDPGVFLDAAQFLRVVVCDECVEKAARAGLVTQGHPQPQPETVYTTWVPES